MMRASLAFVRGLSVAVLVLVGSSARAAQPISQLMSSGGIISVPGHANDQLGAANGGVGGLSGLVKGNGSSAPTSATAADVAVALAFADVSSLRGWGFVGDGISHPLSGVTSFRGVNATGWTLSQWQLVLPAATSLSNELDWASLQSYINAATGPLAVRFPSNSSRAKFDQPIAVCTQSVSFYGNGNGTNVGQPAGTQLEFTGNTDGFTHCSTTANTKIEAHDLLLATDVSNGSGAGIRDQAANYTVLDNVTFNGFNGYCGYFNNPGFTRLHSVRCLNVQAAGTSGIGPGLYFQGKNSFVNHIDNTLVQGYNVGYQYHSTNTLPDVGIEDTQIRDSACGAVNTCIYIDSASASYAPFNYSFYNISVDVFGQFIVAPTFSNLIVYGGNWLVHQPTGSVGGGSGWTPASSNLIDLGSGSSGGHMARIVDATFGPANTTASANSLLTAESYASDVQLRGNRVSTSLSVTAGYWQIAPGSMGDRERDTIFVNPYNPTAAPSNSVVFNGNTDPSNRFELVAVGVPSVNCGTGATLLSGSNNTDGEIDVPNTGAGGANASLTSCSLTYAQPYRATKPSLQVLSSNTAAVPLVTVNNYQGFTVTFAAGTVGAITYHARPY